MRGVELFPGHAYYNMVIDEMSMNDTTPMNSYTGYTGGPPNEDSWMSTWTLVPTEGSPRILHSNFAFDTGVNPVGKVWVQVDVL